MSPDEAFRRYRTELLSYLARRLCTAQDAEDAAQEAYMRFIRYAASVQDPRAYIFRIAHNVVYDGHRRPEVVIFDSDLAAEAAERCVELSDPSAEQAEREQRVQEALKGLPALYVSILTLRYVAGLSIPEIAHTLGISRFTAKKYLFRALAHCRQNTGAPPP